MAAGLYIHVPFCLKKCAYCDFYSITDLTLKQAYLHSLDLEMEKVSARWQDFFFDSLYIGGGTPSLFSPGEIEKVLARARKRFRFLPKAEVTLEVNPGTVSPVSLQGYRNAGVNRISIGVQSFNSRNLAFLGRVHTAAEAAAAVEKAQQAGFEDIGMDLIYGLPDQTEAKWRADLGKAVALDPSHLSCYLLSFEEGTVLSERLKAKAFRPLSQKRQAHLFLETSRFLEDRGFDHYEISNFARMREGAPGANRSRHNRKYWEGAPYAGLGPAAHSFSGNERSWNVKTLEEYLEATVSGRLPVEAREALSPGQERTEAVYLGLRRREGIFLRDFEKRFGARALQNIVKEARQLEEQGLAILTSERMALTRRGMLFLDGIAEAIASRLS